MAIATADLTTGQYRHGTGWTLALDPALDSPRTLVVAFGAPALADNGSAIDDLHKAYPNSHIIGCSTAGEIHGTELLDESLVVAVKRFSHTRLQSASAQVGHPDESHKAGAAIGTELNGPELKAVFVVSDGLNVNGSQLVRGMASVLPGDVVITGGLAADGADFKRTWVLERCQAAAGTITAVGFYGDRVRVGHGSSGGWDVFGPQRKVTRAEGNVLHELDGQPALPLYKKYLGNRADDLPGSALLFPLALLKDRHDKNPLVRTILAVDDAEQTMTFAGDIPTGSIAQLMRANFDRLINGAEDSALMLRDNHGPTGPCLCIAISCVGRRLVLGARTEEEIERVAETLPQGSCLVGFYSYGEVSPLASGACDLHNQTMTLTTIAEV